MKFVKRFRFDRGPSLFTMPEVLDEIFTARQILLIITTSSYLLSQSIFIQTVKYFMRMQMLKNSPRNLNGSSVKKVIMYWDLHHAQKVFELTEEVFLRHPLRDAWRYVPKYVLPKAASLRRLKAFTSLNTLHRKYFTTPEAIQLFNRYATYNGSDPYSAPGTMAVISHLEHNHGAFIMDKGMHHVVQSLIQLGKN